jgi:CubicO group peptidase (beta-lactamase class C family)
MFLAFFLAVVPTTHSKDTKGADAMNDFPNYAESIITEWEVPGMAVGVVKDGEVIFLKGFGYRDVAKRLPVTPETLFAIGSSTKAFTALAVGMLVDENKLDLDKPIIEYMPDFRLFDDYATLHATPRDLLCHRTGMPGYDALWWLSHRSREGLYHRLRYLKPSAGFRDVFQYNNLMYMVAGLMVGRLAGVTWEDFVAERIFVPLQMNRSNFSAIDSQKTENFSQPYVTFTGKPAKIPFRNLGATGPAGSIYSNIEDMSKWMLLHLNKGKAGEDQIITEASLSETHLPNMAIRDPLLAKLAQSTIYGQGWYISDFRGRRLLEHGGNIDGFSGLVSMLPEEKLGVVVLSNSPNIAGHVIARDIYDRFLGPENLGLDKRDWNTHYKTLFAELMALFAASERAIAKPKPKTNHSLPVADYTGIYEHQGFGRAEVTAEGGNLEIRFQSGLTSELEHFHYDVFKGTTTDFYLPSITVRFRLSDAGNVDSFSMPIESTDIFFKKQ